MKRAVSILLVVMVLFYFKIDTVSSNSNGQSMANDKSNPKMRTFLQNKLWRDKAINMMEQNHGSRIHWRVLDDHEFDKEIRAKLLEEAREAAEAKNRKELIAELADLYEVIDSLASVNNISRDDIIDAQTKKREERGGFAGRRFVETADHPEGGFGEKYCLADPQKYPEII
jgi:predicted house-cleaning noncanonical NTP pyrophosphatase (MazG superfamily)